MEKQSNTLYAQAMRAYVGLLVFAVCLYALMYCPQALLNTISQEFGSGMAETGTLVGVFMLSMAVSPLFVGVLLDKTGVRRALLASAGLLAASGVLVWHASSLGWLLGVRLLQSLLMPVGLTAIMSAVSSLFRHLDLSRALAGYIACNLVGSLTGRIAGGLLAELVGWRAAMTTFSAVMLVALIMICLTLRENSHHHGRVHRPAEYLGVFRIPAVPTLLFVEACGIFAFAGMGNLIPFRMAELGTTGSGHVGLMYAGYAVGLVAAIWIRPMTTLFRGTARLLGAAAILYAACLPLILFDSRLVLFASIWALALWQFVLHAQCPGLINRRTAGLVDRGIVNGLFLSCYYVGGCLGSILPVWCYGHLGWTGAWGIMQLVLLCSCAMMLRALRRYPEVFA